MAANGNRARSTMKKDPDVEDAVVVGPNSTATSQAQAVVPPVAAPPDSPMPTIENEGRYIFTGGRCSVLDIREILIAQVLELQNVSPIFPKGTLRNLTISEALFDLLSDSAQQWMTKDPGPPAGGSPVESPQKKEN